MDTTSSESDPPREKRHRAKEEEKDGEVGEHPTHHHHLRHHTQQQHQAAAAAAAAAGGGSSSPRQGDDDDTPPDTEDHPRAKRRASKREPQAGEFPSPADFDQAWRRWRTERDMNNLAVKRSRQRAKQRPAPTPMQVDGSSSDPSDPLPPRQAFDLERKVAELQGNVLVLMKALRAPASLEPPEHARLQTMLCVFDAQTLASVGAVPVPPVSSAPSSSSASASASSVAPSQQEGDSSSVSS